MPRSTGKARRSKAPHYIGRAKLWSQPHARWHIQVLGSRRPAITIQALKARQTRKGKKKVEVLEMQQEEGVFVIQLNMARNKYYINSWLNKHLPAKYHGKVTFKFRPRESTPTEARAAAISTSKPDSYEKDALNNIPEGLPHTSSSRPKDDREEEEGGKKEEEEEEEHEGSTDHSAAFAQPTNSAMLSNAMNPCPVTLVAKLMSGRDDVQATEAYEGLQCASNIPWWESNACLGQGTYGQVRTLVAWTEQSTGLLLYLKSSNKSYSDRY